MQNQAGTGPEREGRRGRLPPEEQMAHGQPGNVPGCRTASTACDPASYFPVFLAPAILRDARGCTYRAVRSCDLDRICDK